VRAEFSYLALDPRADNVIAVLTLSSLRMQNWYPAAGTGTDTVQVPVQTAIPDGAARVMEALGVGTATAGTAVAGISPAAIAAELYTPGTAVACRTCVVVVSEFAPTIYSLVFGNVSVTAPDEAG